MKVLLAAACSSLSSFHQLRHRDKCIRGPATKPLRSYGFPIPHGVVQVPDHSLYYELILAGAAFLPGVLLALAPSGFSGKEAEPYLSIALTERRSGAWPPAEATFSFFSA